MPAGTSPPSSPAACSPAHRGTAIDHHTECHTPRFADSSVCGDSPTRLSVGILSGPRRVLAPKPSPARMLAKPLASPHAQSAPAQSPRGPARIVESSRGHVQIRESPRGPVRIPAPPRSTTGRPVAPGSHSCAPTTGQPSSEGHHENDLLVCAQAGDPLALGTPNSIFRQRPQRLPAESLEAEGASEDAAPRELFGEDAAPSVDPTQGECEQCALKLSTPGSVARAGRGEQSTLVKTPSEMTAEVEASEVRLAVVRASSNVQQLLGTKSVVTPVRRSTRGHTDQPLAARQQPTEQLLDRSGYSYTPNRALCVPPVGSENKPSNNSSISGRPQAK